MIHCPILNKPKEPLFNFCLFVINSHFRLLCLSLLSHLLPLDARDWSSWYRLELRMKMRMSMVLGAWWMRMGEIVKSLLASSHLHNDVS